MRSSIERGMANHVSYNFSFLSFKDLKPHLGLFETFYDVFRTENEVEAVFEYEIEAVMQWQIAFEIFYGHSVEGDLFVGVRMRLDDADVGSCV